MRYKIVPPVRDVDFLRNVADALPRVPNSVEDCCTRIRDRTDVPSRDRAREYLTFCQALGLAAETDGAYFRDPDPPDDGELSIGFVDGVFGAREVLDRLEGAGDERESKGEGGEDDGDGGKDDERDGDGTVSVETAFDDAIEPLVPRWERNQGAEWETTWRERTERLCEWAVVFDLAERVDGGYRILGPGRNGQGE